MVGNCDEISIVFHKVPFFPRHFVANEFSSYKEHTNDKGLGYPGYHTRLDMLHCHSNRRKNCFHFKLEMIDENQNTSNLMKNNMTTVQQRVKSRLQSCSQHRSKLNTRKSRELTFLAILKRIRIELYLAGFFRIFENV